MALDTSVAEPGPSRETLRFPSREPLPVQDSAGCGLELELMTRFEIRKHWPEIRQGLETVISKCCDHLLVEDFFVMLMNEQMTMLGAFDPNRVFHGFMVITITDRPDGRECFIWAIYAKAQTLPADSMRLWHEFEDSMRLRGCIRLSMMSSRNGWRQTARTYGLIETMTQYEKYL